MQYLKDILIETGDIERYFDEIVPVNLWRAKNLSSKDGVFDFVENKIIRNNGKIRPADITIEKRAHVD